MAQADVGEGPFSILCAVVRNIASQSSVLDREAGCFFVCCRNVDRGRRPSEASLEGRVVDALHGAVLRLLLGLQGLAEPLAGGRHRQAALEARVVPELGLAAVLNKLLDLHGQPAELVLVLLVQVALQLPGRQRGEKRRRWLCCCRSIHILFLF